MNPIIYGSLALSAVCIVLSAIALGVSLSARDTGRHLRSTVLELINHILQLPARSAPTPPPTPDPSPEPSPDIDAEGTPYPSDSNHRVIGRCSICKRRRWAASRHIDQRLDDGATPWIIRRELFTLYPDFRVSTNTIMRHKLQCRQSQHPQSSTGAKRTRPPETREVERLHFIALARSDAEKSGGFFERSQTATGEALGVSRDIARKVIQACERAGLLVVDRPADLGRGYPTRYRVVISDHALSPDVLRRTADDIRNGIPGAPKPPTSAGEPSALPGGR